MGWVDCQEADDGKEGIELEGGELHLVVPRGYRGVCWAWSV